MLGALPQAFQRREGEEYLSVTWLEHFAPDYEDGLIAATAAIRSQLTVKRRDGFAVGGVGKIAETCESVDVSVRVLHEPEPPKNTGHSAMRGIPRENLQLLALLADEVFIDTRVAAAIPAAAPTDDGPRRNQE